MIWRHKLTLWNILLVGGTCLLLVGIYSTWWGSDHPDSSSHAVKGANVPTAPILRDQQPMSAFEVVVHKNLFSQDRRGPSQNQADQQNLLEGHQLLGIIIIGDTRAALIGAKNPPGKKEAEIDVVYLGEQWNGYKVEEITNESVLLQGKDGTKAFTFPE